MLPICQYNTPFGQSIASLIPQEVSLAFKLLHQTHLCVQIFQNIDFVIAHPYECAFGQSLYVVARNVPPIQLAAQAIMIVRKTITAIEAKSAVEKSYRTMLRFMTPVPVPVQLVRHTLLTRYRFRNTAGDTIVCLLPHCLVESVYRIIYLAQYAFALLSACLQLSSALIDLFQSIVPNETNQYEGITGIATNAREIYERFTAKSPALYQKLQEHQKQIDLILTNAGLPITCEMITTGAETVIIPIAETVESVSSIFNNMKTSLPCY